MANRAPDSFWPRAATGLALGALTGLVAHELELLSVLSIWGDRALIVVGGGILGAVIGCTRWRGLIGAAAGGAVGLWLLVAFTPLCALLAQGLPRRDPVGRADAIFVLASRLQADGEPTPDALSRLLHALELLGQSLAPRLILSEQRPPARSYAEAARPILDHLGLRTELLTVGPVRNTHDEAEAVGALFRMRGWKRLLVVTSPTHSRRACAALEHEGIVVLSSPSMETRFDLETLDRADDRLVAFGSLIHERVGFWVYRRRGWILH
ncbi:MAG TPA: YdcF family protein [Vicinamibacteria bacterium]|jgi:uncharacterized SAM-binding protein YcdF (DUF218 family)|nr:YdcF family protein [Vicinamibacteria bacterium]